MKKKSSNSQKPSLPSERIVKPKLAAIPENHIPENAKMRESIRKEPFVRTTIDIPKSWHKAIKKFLIDEDMSMKDYLQGLLEKDLRNRNMTYDQTEFV